MAEKGGWAMNLETIRRKKLDEYFGYSNFVKADN